MPRVVPHDRLSFQLFELSNFMFALKLRSIIGVQKVGSGRQGGNTVMLRFQVERWSPRGQMSLRPRLLRHIGSGETHESNLPRPSPKLRTTGSACRLISPGPFPRPAHLFCLLPASYGRGIDVTSTNRYSIASDALCHQRKQRVRRCRPRDGGQLFTIETHFPNHSTNYSTKLARPLQHFFWSFRTGPGSPRSSPC